MRIAPALAALLLAAAPAGGEDERPPQDVGLVERATSRLAQLDVTVSGPDAAIRRLTAGDFVLKLNDRTVTGLIVDDLCGAPAAPPRAGETVPGSPPPSPRAAEKGTVATFLLYFDQAHLTQAGRMGAIEVARGILPKLLAGGNRAMLVSSARELKTLVPLTGDVSKLDSALAAMVGDVADFDTYATTEEDRLAEVADEMKVGIDRAVSLARRYALEERVRQERDLTRLRMVMGSLDAVDPPKAVLYFADTMRQNPGEHYLAFFSGSTIANANGVPTPEASAVGLEASTGATVLDRVINEASGNGIRFYAVEGQGLTATSALIQARGTMFDTAATSRTGASNHPSAQLNHQRLRDAQGTLVAMAAETGGRAFVNGLSAARVSSGILDDLSCVYLLSFDPKGWPVDTPLAVSLHVTRPKVKAAVRGRLVIESDSRRLTARLLAAYAAPKAKDSPVGLRVGVTPIGYDAGRFQARVQVAVPPSAIPGTTWDLGASLVSRGSVGGEGSGRIRIASGGVPVVWEKDMEFFPGSYDLVAVAHEATTDTVASKDVQGTWPDLDAELATLGPITVSQPARGGFMRNGKAATSGAVVVPPDQPLAFDEPTAVISFVCRARDQKKPLRVARTLIGETETPVGDTELVMGEDRCAQIVDLIRPKTLGPGDYRFVVAVSTGQREIVRGEAHLFVPEPTRPGPGPS